MKHKFLGLTLIMLCLFVSCKSDKKETETVIENEVTEESTGTTEATKKTRVTTETKEEPAYYSEKRKVAMRLDSKSGSNATGNIVFTQEGGVVTMIGVFDGLSPGEHTIHMLTNSNCDSDIKNNDNIHNEDIGKITANNNGHSTTTKITNKWCLGCGVDSNDILNKAIVVYEGVGTDKAILACGKIIQ